MTIPLLSILLIAILVFLIGVLIRLSIRFGEWFWRFWRRNCRK